MKGFKAVTTLIVAVCFLLGAGLIAIADDVPDKIEMKSPEFKDHTKGIVTLHHKKHTEEYGAKCEDCHHHYEGGNNVWKQGDEVKKCTECHKHFEIQAGKEQKEFEKAGNKETDSYYGAIHLNCKECHKAFNKEKGSKAAPTSCKDCHPKEG